MKLKHELSFKVILKMFKSQRRAWISAPVVVGSLAFAGVGAAGLAATGMLSLTINGKVASSDVRMINGEAYVPLRAVAQAFNQQIVRQPGGFALLPAGGAHEIGDNHKGKIGTDLFTGEFMFKVLAVHEVKEYKERHSAAGATITPNAGETLFVVDCRLKNGTLKKQNLVFSSNETYGNPHTALTDMQEHSYATINWHGHDFEGYDVHTDETYPDGAYVLPGAAIDFALVFSAPPGTQPKDLIFSILKYEDHAHAKDKAVDVRVALTP